jgi:hypothetical protein
MSISEQPGRGGDSRNIRMPSEPHQHRTRNVIKGVPRNAGYSSIRGRSVAVSL